MKHPSILIFAALLVASCAPKIAKTTRISGEIPAGLTEINIRSEKLDTLVRGEKGRFVFECPTDLASMLFIEAGVADLQVIPDGTKLEVVLSDSSYVHSRTPEISAQERLNTFMAEASDCIDYESMKALALRTINAEKDNVIGAVAFQSSYQLMSDDEMGQALRTLSAQIRSFGVIPLVERIYNSRKETSSGCKFRDFSVRTIVGYEYGLPSYRNVSLSDIAGNGNFILLYFWNPYDENSISQLPFIQKVKEDFGKKGMDIVSVALYADAEEAYESARAQGFDWVALNGAEDSIADLYGIYTLPLILYIAPDGTILNRDLFDEDIHAAAEHYFSVE